MFTAQQTNKKGTYINPRFIKAIENFDCANYRDLNKIGIDFRNPKILSQMQAGMDAIQNLTTTASMAVPVQFLQNWLPGFVQVMTAARKIDELVGIMMVGAWEDAQIVQGVLERLGTSQPYGDFTNIPLSSWNVNFEYRSVVRFEEGLQIGILEEARAARVNIDTAAEKREAAARELEIQRNSVGFVGFNNGANKTYGFLNDPNEPAYITAANGASGFPQWSKKTFLEIINDIRTMAETLQNQSLDVINPEDTQMTLAVATAVYQYFSVVTDFGVSVREWLMKTYPRLRIVSAPELNAANGGANVGYLYAERVQDQSTDGGLTFIQPVQTKFMVLGVERLAKGYKEDYSNGTAGVMCKRPFAMVRISGI